MGTVTCVNRTIRKRSGRSDSRGSARYGDVIKRKTWENRNVILLFSVFPAVFDEDIAVFYELPESVQDEGADP